MLHPNNLPRSILAASLATSFFGTPPPGKPDG